MLKMVVRTCKCLCKKYEEYKLNPDLLVERLSREYNRQFKLEIAEFVTAYDAVTTVV